MNHNLTENTIIFLNEYVLFNSPSKNKFYKKIEIQTVQIFNLSVSFENIICRN